MHRCVPRCSVVSCLFRIFGAQVWVGDFVIYLGGNFPAFAGFLDDAGSVPDPRDPNLN